MIGKKVTKEVIGELGTGIELLTLTFNAEHYMGKGLSPRAAREKSYVGRTFVSNEEKSHIKTSPITEAGEGISQTDPTQDLDRVIQDYLYVTGGAGEESDGGNKRHLVREERNLSVGEKRGVNP